MEPPKKKSKSSKKPKRARTPKPQVPYVRPAARYSKASSNPGILAVGLEIRRRRMESNITLEDFAERAKLTPNYIGTVEHGYRDPSISTLQGIADGLNISLGELFGPLPSLSAAALDMARIFEEAPEDMQSGVLRLLRALVRKQRLQG